MEGKRLDTTEVLTLAIAERGVGAYFDPLAALLKQLYVRGEISLSRFEACLAQLTRARNAGEIAEIVAGLPLPVAMTPPERRLAEPVVLQAGMSKLAVTGRWQVGAKTTVSAGMAKCYVDFTQAQFDALETDLHVSAGMSKVVLVVPEHVYVEVSGLGGNVVFGFDRGDWIPGFPVLRLNAQAGIGKVLVVRPAPAVQPRRRRRRRR